MVVGLQQGRLKSSHPSTVVCLVCSSRHAWGSLWMAWQSRDSQVVIAAAATRLQCGPAAPLRGAIPGAGAEMGLPTPASCQTLAQAYQLPLARAAALSWQGAQRTAGKPACWGCCDSSWQIATAVVVPGRR